MTVDEFPLHADWLVVNFGSSELYLPPTCARLAVASPDLTGEMYRIDPRDDGAGIVGIVADHNPRSTLQRPAEEQKPLYPPFEGEIRFVANLNDQTIPVEWSPARLLLGGEAEGGHNDNEQVVHQGLRDTRVSLIGHLLRSERVSRQYRVDWNEPQSTARFQAGTLDQEAELAPVWTSLRRYWARIKEDPSYDVPGAYPDLVRSWQGKLVAGGMSGDDATRVITEVLDELAALDPAGQLRALLDTPREVAEGADARAAIRTYTVRVGRMSSTASLVGEVRKYSLDADRTALVWDPRIQAAGGSRVALLVADGQPIWWLHYAPGIGGAVPSDAELLLMLPQPVAVDDVGPATRPGP